jgi:hypothetical protein
VEQNRWKSPIFWGSTAVTVLGMLMTSGLITSDTTLKIIGFVAGVISVIIGNANNPTNKTGF